MDPALQSEVTLTGLITAEPRFPRCIDICGLRQTLQSDSEDGVFYLLIYTFIHNMLSFIHHQTLYLSLLFWYINETFTEDVKRNSCFWRLSSNICSLDYLSGTWTLIRRKTSVQINNDNNNNRHKKRKNNNNNNKNNNNKSNNINCNNYNTDNNITTKTTISIQQ